MRVLEAFAGIGAWRKALINLDIDYKSVGFIEKDKFASLAYCQLYNDLLENNYNDITKIDYNELPDHDLLCYSPPCQSFSIAGKRKGLDDIRGTLFFYAAKIIETKKPKYAIMENVKGLLSDDNGNTIETILNKLDGLGYNNYMKVLNARHYGIPQNRERVFIVSIRKDIDNLSFEFPKKQKLKLTLQDVIEYGNAPNDISYCLDANYYKGTNLKQFQEKKRRQIIIIDENFKNSRKPRIYKHYSPTIRAKHNDHKVSIQSNPLRHLQRNQKNFPYDYSMCVDASRTTGIKIDEKIRKLTTLECFRLMGFTDQDHGKLKSISNSQKYKLAGNSIVVQVIEAIYKQLFLSKDITRKWLF